ncbi:hypothetical protein [Halobacillus sp. A5]|uniref:hypothetical protein n=1 Tax=Halobacillus sp. A5 TaxID=2880263 RepID=UPI0020A65C33|nr:hypothetical protein [Halobacillus sp. A5]MCP3028624.1 hypothetical protein [Halobacillus sp. A5]
MKKYLAILGLAALLGCSEDTSANESKEQPSQQDLEEQLREEAVPIDFATVNAGEVEEGDKVFIQGYISAAAPADEAAAVFSVTADEEAGEGTYSVENKDEGAEFMIKDIVEVYGTYQGTDDAGTPVIEGTIIESVK